MPDAAQLLQRVDELELRLSHARARARCASSRHRLEALRRGLVHPARRLRESALLLRELRAAARGAAIARAHERARARLGGARRAGSTRSRRSRCSAAATALAVREADRAILRDARQAPPGEGILVRLARGRLRATVRESLED